MGNAYTIKLKKGDVEIEIFGPDKEFVSSKFAESILVAFDKPEVLNAAVNQLPLQVAEQVVLESVKTAEQTAEQPLAQEQAVVAPVEAASEQTIALLEATPMVENRQLEAVVVSVESTPIQETVINNEVMQAVAQPVVQETVEALITEPVVEATVVAPVEAAVNEPAQVPQLGKPRLASLAQISEDDLLKVFGFKKDGFKVNKEFSGTTALKQINMTKLVLIASEYVNGVAQLSGKAVGKHMKAIGTGNLATNLKKDNGIVKDKSFYRLSDVGKQAALELIKSLSQN